MDVERFEQELRELVMRHGGQLVKPVDITSAGAPYQEHYTHPVPEMRGLHMFCAVRDVRPVRLNVSIEMDTAGEWQHVINFTPMSPSPNHSASRQASLFDL